MKINNFPKITVILRNYNYQQARKIVNLLKQSKINAVEIALNSKDGAKILQKLNAEFGRDILIGAGTVLSKNDVKIAAAAGARFVLSPIFSETMIKQAKLEDLICIPGAYSPTEAYNADLLGADIVKLFPAADLSFNYFRALKPPLENLKLMAVGGINLKNAANFLANGADYLGIGSGILQRSQIEAGNYQSLIENIKELEKILDN